MKKELNILGEGRANSAYGLFLGLLLALMVLMGCSKDETSAGGSNGQSASKSELEVASFVTWYDEVTGANRAQGTNRAWEIPAGYVAYEDGIQPIGIAFTQDGVDPAMGSNSKTMIGSFFKSGEKWRTDLEEISAGTYQLYGYIPHQTAVNYSITDLNGANAAYSTGAIMTLENVPTVMPNDLCVVIGAKQGYDRDHDGNNDGTDRLRKGNFSFTSSHGSGDNDYVFLLFDHLYAALSIKMRVHADYDTLRTIRLKSLQLNTQAGETQATKKTTIVIKLEANDGSTSPIKELTFTPTGDLIDGGLQFWSSESDTGVRLTTDFQPFIGHFMPSGVTKLILTSFYDVYDRYDNLIRKDCKATNSVLLSELFTGQTSTERGKRYIVNMTIQPTYLYMLSDPDLDNPTVKIEN